MPATVRGGDRLAATLDAAATRIAEMPAAVHTRAGQLVARAVAAAAPRRSGVLAASFVGRAGGGGAQVTSRARYAGYVNYGTRRMRGRRYVDAGLDAAADPVAQVYADEIDRALGHVRGA